MQEQLTAADVEALRTVARAGNVHVQYKLGALLKYYPELGGPGEFAQWLGQAAERGSGDACWELAEAFLHDGGDANDKRAVAFLTLGATLAHPTCLYNLGALYFSGRGVDADPALGFNYMRRAAMLGDHDAEYNVGLCYSRGIGTPKDPGQAREWFGRAHVAGDARAGPMLEQIGAAPAPTRSSS